MTRDQLVLLAVGGLVVVCLVLSVALLRLRTAAEHTRAELAHLREQLQDLGPRETTPAAAPVEFVITDLHAERSATGGPRHVDRAAFADTVLRETVVKAASLAHGVRRGLAPATRNRIRFEMRQEVRRARKQRRADLKTAQRDLHARQRAALAEEAS